MQTKGLSGNALKVIAIIAMTIDHLAWVGIETYQQAETPMQIGLHCIGRLTAPMMIFFVAEGYYHTHDFRCYLRRLLMLAVVSHFAFCYFNMSGFNPLDNLLFNATSIVGGVFMGTSVGLGLSAGGSTGGSDIIAAIVHKYRDVSLGRIILLCDMTIITSSYVVLRSWEKVLYGYVLLFIVSFCVDYVINSLRQSVQFLIISDKYQEIGEAINKIADRGCSTLNGNGFYSKKDIKVIFCIAKRSESSLIFDLIDEIDPDAFVAQSAVTGVYGQGFDRVKVRKKISLEEINKQIGESAKQS
jgi:uncharacterized membrane-anchored protein YitT (DUF2179 family)